MSVMNPCHCLVPETDIENSRSNETATDHVGEGREIAAKLLNV